MERENVSLPKAKWSFYVNLTFEFDQFIEFTLKYKSVVFTFQDRR